MKLVVIRIYTVIAFVLGPFCLCADPENKPHMGENAMTTEETIQGYFNNLKEKGNWAPFLSNSLVFTSFTSPVKQVSGKAAYLEATKRFYSMIVSIQMRDVVISGEKACVLTRYELQPPKGNAFSSDVAEIFTVKDGQIDSLAIYFDSSPFPK
jgi:SnoaL-like domain